MEGQTQWELFVTNFILTRTRQLKFTAKDVGERGAFFGAASPSKPVMPSSSSSSISSSAVDGFAQCVQRGEAGQRRPLVISGLHDLCQEFKNGRCSMRAVQLRTRHGLVRCTSERMRKGKHRIPHYCTRDFIQMKHEQYGLSNPNIMVSPYLRKEG